MIPNAIQITHRIRGNIIFISITVDIKRPVSVTHSFTRLLLAETSIANAHIEPTNDKKPPATIFFILLTSYRFIFVIIILPYRYVFCRGQALFFASCAFSDLFLSRCSIASCFHTFPHLRLSEATQNPCPLCRLSSYRGTR